MKYKQRSMSKSDWDRQSKLIAFDNLLLKTGRLDCFFIAIDELNLQLKQIKLLSEKIEAKLIKAFAKNWTNNFIFANHLIEGEIFSKLVVKNSLQSAKAMKQPYVIMQRVVNMKNAINFLEQHGTINDHTFNQFYHQLITNFKRENYYDGKYYRLEPVYIGNQQGAHPSLITTMINNLWKFINSAQLNQQPLLKAIVAHFYYEYIHPYYDFNGRSGRILMQWIARDLQSKLQIKILVWILSFQVSKYQQGFKQYHIRNDGNLTFFCKNLLDLTIQGLEFVLYLQTCLNKQLIVPGFDTIAFDLLTMIFLAKAIDLTTLKQQFSKRDLSLNCDANFKKAIKLLLKYQLIKQDEQVIKLV